MAVTSLAGRVSTYYYLSTTELHLNRLHSSPSVWGQDILCRSIQIAIRRLSADWLAWIVKAE